jgi:DNA-binding IclR family transcriptional regulator
VAIDNEENSLNVRCLAAPVFNEKGETIAALGTSATFLQLDEAHLSKDRRIGQRSGAAGFLTNGVFGVN